jgi:hypothetical protein
MSSGTQNGAPLGDRYRILKSLGRGGMGEVFRARDLRDDRELALKRFRLKLDQQDDVLRFRREFHTLARLRHPRIVEAYDFGYDEGGRPYYTMELLDGKDFGDLAPLDWRQSCALLRDIASALAFLHARSLLHRDIAPRNARCTADGRAKLLDFGMLATMGATSEIVGTVHSIAPEMILGFPMDGRADLYGLGSLGFWLLTGRHPRRARNLNDLIREGRTRAPKPSTIVPEIPAELDDLILSLLSHEPLGRPTTAAHVIDRLGAIAELPPAEELEVARGYIRSADLVGRKHELEVVRKRLMRALAGSGGTIVVEGRSGMGKTRLLHEIELEAKLAGAQVFRAQAQIGGPYALLRALGFDGRGGSGHDSGSLPEHSVIGRLLGDDIVGDDSQTFVGVPAKPERTSGGDLREERLALQSALAHRVMRLAEKAPLVVIIDDLQRADEGSAATLASLAFGARDQRVLLVCALRTDEALNARRAVAKIREHAIVLHPGGLGTADVEQLLRTMFGDAPDLPRFARWLRRQAGGSPLHCNEILRHMVDHQLIRDHDGVWSFPDQKADDGLPRGLAESLDARVRALGPHARVLGRALAVHGGRVTLPTCVALARDLNEDEVFAALAQLEHEDVLVGNGERWTMRHEGLREAFLREIDPIERAQIELHVGMTRLGEGPVSAEREATIGWHLLRGGERRNGARLLARAGKRLYDATSYADAIAPLSAALEVYEQTNASPATRVRLLEMLHTAGFYSDRDAAVKYRDQTIDLLGRYAGLGFAKRLRWAGLNFALYCGVAIAWLLRSFLPRGRRGPAPVAALRMWLRAVVYAGGVAGFSFDTDRLRQVMRMLEPVSKLQDPDIANALRFVNNLLAFNLGRIHTVRTSGVGELAAFLENPGEYTIAERRLVIGGATFQRGLAAVRSGSPEALAEIAALERLDTKLWDMGALQLRAHYHLWRGEDDEARRIWTEAELEFVRLGSLWQLECVHHASACVTAAMSGDALGLKRHIEALARQVAAGLNYRAHLDIARSEHSRLRGDFTTALRAAESALAGLPEGEGLIRPWAMTAKADALLGAGKVDEARALAEATIALCDDGEHGQIAFKLRAVRTLAACESAAGEHDIAAARVDRAIEEAEALLNPLLLGSLHEARAEIAMAVGNEVIAMHAAAQVEFWYRPTRNPVLIARWEKLDRALRPTDALNEASANEIVTEMIDAETAHHDTLNEVLSILSDCRTANARAERSLEMFVEAAGAHSGLLYLARRGRLSLAAPTHGIEPAEDMLRAAVSRYSRAKGSPETAALGFEPVDEVASDGWCSSVIACTNDGRTRMIGVLLLKAGERALESPSDSMGEAIAQRLAADLDGEAGSVSVSG